MTLIEELMSGCLRTSDPQNKTELGKGLYYDRTTGAYYKIRQYDPSKFDQKEIMKELVGTEYYLAGIIDLDMCFPFNNLNRYHLYQLKKTPSEIAIFYYKGPCNNGLKKKSGKLEIKWMGMPREQRTYLTDVVEQWLVKGTVDESKPNFKLTRVGTFPERKNKLNIEIDDDVRTAVSAEDTDDDEEPYIYGEIFNPGDPFFIQSNKPGSDAVVPDTELDITDLDDIEHYFERGCECYYGNEPDRLQKASAYLKRAAEVGDADAQYLLGTMYYKGELGSDGKKNAFFNFLMAAKQGDADAQDWLGWMYYKGEGVKKNLNVASEWFNKAAQSGNSNALYNLGALYCDPDFPKVNYAIAKKWLSKAIKKGNDDARVMKEYIDKTTKGNETKPAASASAREGIGSARELYASAIDHLYGNNVEKDVRKAMELMMSAADNGNVKAQFYLGRLYHKGGILEKDLGLAEKYLNEAISNGSADAELYLADIYLASEDEATKAKGYRHVENAARNRSDRAILRLASYYCTGEFFDKDLKQAVIIFRDLAEKNNNLAQYQLAKLYLGENGMKPDVEEATHWMVMASCNGNFKAMNQLVSMISKDEQMADMTVKWLDEAETGGGSNYLKGVMYLNGMGFAADTEKAMSYLDKSAEQGNSVASCILGNIYRNGMYGIGKDYANAEKYYVMSAEQNNPMAQHSLGSMYCYGTGVRKDVEKGLAYYEKAMEGNFVPSYYDYGMLFINGKIVGKDVKKGAEFIIKAAEMNFVRAIEETARMYLEGIYFEQNVDKAVSIYLELAGNGNTNSLCSLGVLYLNGVYVEKDFDKAEKYLRESADMGFYEAEYQLHNLFKDRDDEKSMYWLRKAAEHGFDPACSELAELLIADNREKEAMEVYESMASRGNTRGSLSIVDMLLERHTDEDVDKAIGILREMVDNGSSRAAYRLWRFYSEGDRKDIDNAVLYLMKSAELGYAKAEAALAQELEKGEIVEKDLAKSLEYAKRSADKMDEFGLIVLANKYEKGLGTEVDQKEAFRIYTLAAEKGNWNAILTVASFLKKGIGVNADLGKALEWYMRALDSGLNVAGFYAGRLMLEMGMDPKRAVELITIAAEENTDAMLMLGKMYYNGDNVEEDTGKALVYLNRAKDKGCETAAEAIRKINGDTQS